MGLSIKGKTINKSIGWSYSRLHNSIRYLALKYCGMPDEIGERVFTDEKIDSFRFFMTGFVFPNDKIDSEMLMKLLTAIQLSGHVFPNIMLHSDCEGNYTKNGKVNPFGNWTKGNSLRLFKELIILLDDNDLRNIDTDRIKNAYIDLESFYDLVDQEIKEGTGTIIFL